METKKKRIAVKPILSALTVAVVLALLAVSVVAWFLMQQGLLSYAPIAKPEPLFIGAGHRNFDAQNHAFTDNYFEDIRYLYFNGIDVNAEQEYYDYVFCVYGSMVPGYKIQLAYTTNNQFTYEIYHATESTTPSEGAIAYTTHTDNPQTYYYTAYGAPLAGDFVNARTVSGETLANDLKHELTYGDYDEVDKYGEPLYWQTTNIEPGYANGDFITYYILRVNVNDKEINDRETDVICFAAKSFSS